MMKKDDLWKVENTWQRFLYMLKPNIFINTFILGTIAFANKDDLISPIVNITFSLLLFGYWLAQIIWIRDPINGIIKLLRKYTSGVGGVKLHLMNSFLNLGIIFVLIFYLLRWLLKLFLVFEVL